jgi:hypothetical protein
VTFAARKVRWPDCKPTTGRVNNRLVVHASYQVVELPHIDRHFTDNQSLTSLQRKIPMSTKAVIDGGRSRNHRVVVDGSEPKSEKPLLIVQ